MADNFFGITNTGKLRDNNEDAFIAQQLSNGWILACVIDGVGGYEGGEVAAEIARDTVLQKLQQLGNDVIQLLKQTVLLANENIYKEKLNSKGSNQMACVLTIALVDVEHNQFYYAHVGDTRLYLLRDESLVKVTKDHSFVGFLEDSGRLSEKEAMMHPKRNEINKALGFDAHIELKEDYIETGSSPFLPGDMLLLCSDGLSDLVNKKEMTSILVASKSLKEKSEGLVEAANNAGGKDNITVVLVFNNKKQQKTKATKPLTTNTKKNENNEEISPVKATENQIEEQVIPQQKKKVNPAILILSLLCLLLAATAYWLWTKKKEISKPVEKPVEEKPISESEKKLSDSLGLASRFLNLSDSVFGKNILLNDTVFVRQDSLHINGNGIVLQSDSAYKGPAFLVTNNNQYLLLENITFKDFATAVLLQGKKIELKKVQFLNCGVPVQHQLFLQTDQPLTGVVRDTINVKTDTTSNHH